MKAAQILKDIKDIKFVLLGNGPEKSNLLQMRAQMQLDNVFFYDAVVKSQMQAIITQTDAAIIPLKRLDLFKGAIPSKIFENLALKKPILLGVEGEAKTLFIDEGKCGLSFIPEDYNDLAKNILILYNDKNLARQMGDNGLKYAKDNFNRDIIAEEFYKELISL